MELGICSAFGYKLTFEERIKLIKDAGFESVMIWWGENQEAQPEIIRKYNIKIENAHFSFAGIDSIWKDSPDGDVLLNKYLSYIDDCRMCEIPAAVMHFSGGDNPPPYNNLGLDRFKKLFEKAEKNGITIALENVWRPDYLDFIYKNIKSDYIKFCYDSGHENCFTKGFDYLSEYGDKLAALHLHDNDGKSDQHNLPFSGTVDWKRIMKKLREINYKGTLSLEINAQYSGEINAYTAEAYLLEAKSRADRLIKL